MIRLESEFEILHSDQVALEGLLASDVRSMWRRLARADAVRAVRRKISSDWDRICALASFVDSLLLERHEPHYRHPHDIAICAALIVLENSPLPVVRNLFSRLQKEERPSLVWVKRMADYCDMRFIPSAHTASSNAITQAPTIVEWHDLSALESNADDGLVRFTLELVA